MKKSDDLRQIKDLLEIVRHKVDLMKISRTGESASIQLIKDQQSVMNEKLNAVVKDLEEVKDFQEQRLLRSLITIETEIKAYGDMYKINNNNNKKLEERIEVLEDKSDVTPPPELTLTEVH